MRICTLTLFVVCVGLVLTKDDVTTPIRYCEDPAPGVARMSRGIDITNMDLFSTDKSNNGFRRVVFDLTCNKGRRFRHGTLNKVFDWPDQVSQINTSPSGHQKFTANFTETVEKLNKQFSLQAKIKIGGLFLHQVTDSNRFDTQLDVMLQQNRKIVEVSLFKRRL